MNLPAAKNAWVIGGAGFLGAAVVACCRAAGWRVLVVDPACVPAEHALRAEAAAPGTAAQAAQRLSPPHVIYFCASTRGGDAAAYRRTYVQPVLQATAAAPGAHPVFCSSCSVYADGGVVTEQSPTPGATEQQRALLEAESAVLRAGGAVARLAALYGPGRCELLRRHLAGEPCLAGEPGRILNYVHVQDAARALLLLAGTSGVYNVCAETFTKAEAYATLARLTGLAPSEQSAQAARRGSANHRILAQRLRSELAWAPQVTFHHFVEKHIQSANNE